MDDLYNNMELVICRIKKTASIYLYTIIALKVPKWEIFDRSDFHDFYSIKPIWVGDFGAKI